MVDRRDGARRRLVDGAIDVRWRREGGPITLPLSHGSSGIGRSSVKKEAADLFEVRVGGGEELVEGGPRLVLVVEDVHVARPDRPFRPVEGNYRFGIIASGSLQRAGSGGGEADRSLQDRAVGPLDLQQLRQRRQFLTELIDLSPEVLVSAIDRALLFDTRVANHK